MEGKTDVNLLCLFLFVCSIFESFLRRDILIADNKIGFPRRDDDDELIRPFPYGVIRNERIVALVFPLMGHCIELSDVSLMENAAEMVEKKI